MNRSGSACRRLLARTALVAVAGMLVTGISGAKAQTLEEALAQAYQDNPTLDAARAELRATDELVPQALSGYRPRVEAEASISGGLTNQRVSGQGSSSSSGTQERVALSVVQPLYRGGRTEAGVSRAENTVQSQRAQLDATEQGIFLDVSTVYLNLVRDQALVALNESSIRVIERQLEAAQDRFRVGEVTRTDVSQAESRLAGAEAAFVQAQGQLRASRAEFEKLVGIQPQDDLTQPDILLPLPQSLEEALDQARQSNPGLRASQFVERAASDSIDEAFGALLPEITLQAEVSTTFPDNGGSSGPSVSRRDEARVVANISIPIYQAGLATSQVRQARAEANQRRIEIMESERGVVEDAVASWEALMTAEAQIDSRQSQVEAAEIALDGVRREADVGARTTLDVLDAEQELLEARTDLVEAERNRMVAAFTVLAATGQLTADRLGLSVDLYNPEANYNRVRDMWWGLD